ncbi:MAG TPA: hypothetical protein VLW45_05310 [Pelomicrobium sp.]|nr:hypothetical protein [Pelomicrobium sp.]
MQRIDRILLVALVAGGLAATGAVAAETSSSKEKSAQAPASAPETGAKEQKQSGGQQQATGEKVPVVMQTVMPVTALIPVELSARIEKEGCWARLYAEQNFNGVRYLLIGPIALQEIEARSFANWFEPVESMEIGPRAIVTLYDNARFRDKNITITGPKQIRDLDSKLGFFEAIKSLRLNCT